MAFHVNPSTGDAGQCRAVKGRCPFAAEDEHFSSAVEARQHFEKSQVNLPDAKSRVSTGALLTPQQRSTILMDKVFELDRAAAGELVSLPVGDAELVEGSATDYYVLFDGENNESMSETFSSASERYRVTVAVVESALSRFEEQLG